jgi:23S rRNA (guanosine2251-2'-O)-methyltransferase
LEKKDDFIFGIRAVTEAILAGKELEKVLMVQKPDSEIMRDLFPLLRKNNIPFQYVPVEKLNRVSRKNHQGVIAFLSMVSYSPLEEVITSVFEEGKDPRFLMLDQVSDVRNFGAIARSAECMGFSGIIIPEKGSARINADAVKTSAGALMNIPVCRTKSLEAALEYLKDSGLKIIAVSEKGDKLPYQVDLRGPLVFILGGEEKGISPSLLKYAQMMLKIPMTGKTTSLNVSVAASIMMYEQNKQSWGGA